MTAVFERTPEVSTEARHAARQLLGLGTPDELGLLESSSKSTVLRATWRHPRRLQVVLKRCDPAAAENEAVVHAEVLIRLPVRTPRLLSRWCEGSTTWLAFEDMGDEPPSLEDDRQRALVSRWIGELHSASRGLTDLPPLPDRGACHYLARLERARAHLAERQTIVDREDRLRLNRAAKVCDLLLSRWTEVEKAASRLPVAFVHADLAAENLRLVRSGGGVAVTAIDWEKAGLGTPFADLSNANLEEYARAADAPLEVVTSSAWVARLLRTLSHNWASKPIDKLGRRRRRLERDLAAMP